MFCINKNEKVPDLVQTSYRRFEVIEVLRISSAQSRGSHCSPMPKLQSKPQRLQRERERERKITFVLCVYNCIYIRFACALKMTDLDFGEDIILDTHKNVIIKQKIKNLCNCGQNMHPNMTLRSEVQRALEKCRASFTLR